MNSSKANLDFIIDTPPPTISGHLHIGHIYSYCQLDVIARYKRLYGYNVFFPIGFDCNGLPTEKLLEKHKKEIEDGKAKRDIIDLYVNKNIDLFNQINISFDYKIDERLLSKDNHRGYYLTLEKDEIATKTFNILKEKGYIYEAKAVIYWDKKYNTALSNTEIVEKDGKLYGERSGCEIERRKSKEYFVKQVTVKDELLKLVEKLEFKPAKQKQVLVDWIKGIDRDWCISRNREFGVKIPNTNKVFDTWFVSALTPYYFYNNQQENTIRFQGKDIVRCWCYYSILISYLLYKKLPFKQVLCAGMCVDNNGNKMSKSIGNVIDPLKLIDKIKKQYNTNTADIIRYWCACYSLGQDVIYNEQKFIDANRLLIKLKNAVRYVKMYNTKHNYKFDKTKCISETGFLDHVRHFECELVEHHRYRLFMDDYDYSKAKEIMERYFFDVFCDKNIEYSKKTFNGRVAYALNMQLIYILQSLKPFIPNTCEELLKTMFDEDCKV